MREYVAGVRVICGRKMRERMTVYQHPIFSIPRDDSCIGQGGEQKRK